ncbi:MAG: hypothetical protein ACOCWM_03970 [Cyclobacteriaceae bacterium]
MILATFDNKLEALDFLDTIASVLLDDEAFTLKVRLDGEYIYINDFNTIQCNLISYDPETYEYEYEIRTNDESILNVLKRNKVIG